MKGEKKMKRYIDAYEAKKRMFSYYDCVNEMTKKDNYHGETLMSYEVSDMIEDCIENTPTADVQEVRHGMWIETRPGHCQCSICKRGNCCSWFKTEYCERCGAKMDVKE